MNTTTKTPAQAQQQVSAQLKPMDLIKAGIDKMTDQLEGALGSAVPTDRFKMVALNAIAANPKLLEADRQSLYVACMKAATDGLVLDNKEATLVTFNTNKGSKDSPKWVAVVQYMPMVRGLIKLMLLSGGVQKVGAHVVYENDTFEHLLGMEESIVHKRPALGKPRGEAIGAYAIAHLSGDRGTQIVVMDEAQIAAVEKCAKDTKVWKGDFWDQQWEKTVIRRLSKRVEMGGKIQSAFAHDDENYDLDKSSEATETPAAQKVPGGTRAAAKVLEHAASNKAPVQTTKPEPKNKQQENKAPAPSQPKEDDAVDAEFSEMGNPADPGPNDDDIPI